VLVNVSLKPYSSVTHNPLNALHYSKHNGPVALVSADITRQLSQNRGLFSQTHSIFKHSIAWLSGIAKIVCCAERKYFLRLNTLANTVAHLASSAGQTLENAIVRSGQSELKILVSVVQFRLGPPSHSKALPMCGAFLLSNTLSTLGYASSTVST
jgi:hypothetical protein